VEHFFTSLSKRQTMLLLTGVTFGGQEVMESFEFLGEHESALLKFRAQDLLQIPREKRIPVLVQEIKRLVTTRPNELYGADPNKLAEVLYQERVATRDILLAAFPEGLADAVKVYLPPSAGRPSKKLRPEILPILRWRLEEVLSKAGARRAHFKFSDMLLLQTRELLTLADHMGARALGPAMAGLVTADREAFLGSLPPDLKQMAERTITQLSERKMADADAKDLIALHAGEKGPPESIRSAGAQRLARACLAQSPEFAARLVERQRGEFGALLVKWVREERAKAVNRGDGGRTEIVEELEWLEQEGLINKPLRMPVAPKKGAPVRPPPGRAPANGPPPEKARAPAPLAQPNRPPSQRVPLAAQARGASASAQFKAAAEAAAPKQSHTDWMAEREKRKAGMSSQWNMPRPIQGGPSEPAITIPPHLVKRGAPAAPAPVVPAEKTPPEDLSQERTTPPKRDPSMKGVAEELTRPPQKSRPQLSARPAAPSKPLGQYDVTGPMPRPPSRQLPAARPPSQKVPQVQEPPGGLGEQRPRTSPALSKMPLKKAHGTSVSRMPRVVGPEEVTDPGSGSGRGETTGQETTGPENTGPEKTDHGRED
jgi:hypothetical protein